MNILEVLVEILRILGVEEPEKRQEMVRDVEKVTQQRAAVLYKEKYPQLGKDAAFDQATQEVVQDYVAQIMPGADKGQLAQITALMQQLQQPQA